MPYRIQHASGANPDAWAAGLPTWRALVRSHLLQPDDIRVRQRHHDAAFSLAHRHGGLRVAGSSQVTLRREARRKGGEGDVKLSLETHCCAHVFLGEI